MYPHFPGSKSVEWESTYPFITISIHIIIVCSQIQSIFTCINLEDLKRNSKDQDRLLLLSLSTSGKGDSERLHDLFKTLQLLNVMLNSKWGLLTPNQCVFFLPTTQSLFKTCQWSRSALLSTHCSVYTPHSGAHRTRKS